MSLEDYTLGTLRTRLLEEFGIADNVANRSIVDKKINDAIAWIVGRRKNWPWLERNVSLDVGCRTSALGSPIKYGAGVFTLAQNYVIGASYNLETLAAREFVSFTEPSQASTDGLLVESVSGNTFQLRHGYRGDGQICFITSIVVGNPTIINVNLATFQGGTAEIPTHVAVFGVTITGNFYTNPGPNTLDGTHFATRISNTQFSIPVDTTGATMVLIGVVQLAREFVISQGYFLLPPDFISSWTGHVDEDVNQNSLTYKHPTLFERLVRESKIITNLNRIYTVVVDPINVDVDRKYLSVYPRYTDRNVIHIKYAGDTKKLVNDADLPDIPRSDRLVVLSAAAWFVAQWQKDLNMLAVHRDSALQEVERMATEYQLSDDITESVSLEGNEIGPLRGPDGFPEFELP